MDWQFNYLVVVVGLVAAIVTYLATRLGFHHKLAAQHSEGHVKANEAVKLALAEYKSSPEVLAMTDLRYKEGYQAGSADAVKNYKTSEGYEALMAVEHAKGKVAGMAEEKAKRELSYTPVVISDDGYFSKSVEMGYDLNLYYGGMPVSQPIRHITHSEKKSKDDNIEKFVNIAEGMVQVAVSIAAKQNIPVTLNRHKTETKKVDKKKAPEGASS